MTERTLADISTTIEVYCGAKAAFDNNITADRNDQKYCDFLQSQGAIVYELKKQVKADFNWLIDHYWLDNGTEPCRLARRIIEVL